MTHICAQSGHLFYKESLARCLNEVESLETCVLRTDNRSQEQFIAAIDLQCVSPLVGRSTTITVGRTFAHQGEKMQAHMLALRPEHIGDPLVRQCIASEAFRRDVKGFYTAFLDLLWGAPGYEADQGREEEHEMSGAHFSRARRKLRVEVLATGSVGLGLVGLTDEGSNGILSFLSGEEPRQADFAQERLATAQWRAELAAAAQPC